MVLCGITRKHILDICRHNRIEVRTEAVSAAAMNEFDAIFMTGTSPMVLPFSSVGDHRYSVNYTLIDRLRELYKQRVEENIQEFRRENDIK
jgi:branched-chain amino acid aminotransferase